MTSRSHADGEAFEKIGPTASEWQAGVESAVCFVNGCDYDDIDPRGPVWLRDDTMPYYACVAHWEAIFRILGEQAGSPDAMRWVPAWDVAP